MNFNDWYTDLVDVYRVTATLDGKLTRHTRTKMYSDVPCRVYEVTKHAPNMERTAADIKQESKLACDNAIDIKAGDELIIHRGARVGAIVADLRAFAGDPNHYFEPFGAVIPDLAHQEIALLQQERIS